MSALIKAGLIEVGTMLSLPPKEALTIEPCNGRPDYLKLTLKITDTKTAYLFFPADSFLEVHDPNPETPEMPDEEEILERVLALAISPGPTLEGIPVAQVLAWLVECNVFDIPRLIELTNDLGPFESGLPGRVVEIYPYCAGCPANCHKRLSGNCPNQNQTTTA